MRLTTRQTIQLHGVIKFEPQGDAEGDRRGAARHHRGLRRRQPQRDVRSPIRISRSAHAAALELARAHLRSSRRRARRPIARSGSTARRSPAASADDVEPIYGKTYMPRKFKIGSRCRRRTTSTCSRTISASSPSSTRTDNIEGWNVTVGGGMGMTHGEPDTYPRTADVMGFCRPRRRDRGRRGGRHRAARLGRPLQPQARAAEIHHRGSRARRVPRRGRAARRQAARAGAAVSRSPRPATATAGPKARTASSHLTLFIENGRVERLRRRRAAAHRPAATSPRCTTATSGSRRTRT